MSDHTIGQEMALAMLSAAQEDFADTTSLDLLNAIGNCAVGTFCCLSMSRKRQLEEFDNWATYTRQQIKDAP